jgi:hypothetical protein
MATQTVKKGSFDFKPNKIIPYFGFKEVGYVAVFHENCNYDYNDEDQQKDWLKLGGVAFALFPWDKYSNTAMVGFRYNPQTDRIELLDYWHRNGVTDRGIGRSPIASVKRGEKFIWWIRVDQSKKEVSLNIRTQEGTVSKTMTFSKLSTALCWPVGGYAGGDIKAVQDMSFAEGEIHRWNADGPVPEFTNWS